MFYLLILLGLGLLVWWFINNQENNFIIQFENNDGRILFKLIDYENNITENNIDILNDDSKINCIIRSMMDIPGHVKFDDYYHHIGKYMLVKNFKTRADVLMNISDHDVIEHNIRMYRKFLHWGVQDDNLMKICDEFFANYRSDQKYYRFLLHKRAYKSTFNMLVMRYENMTLSLSIFKSVDLY